MRGISFEIPNAYGKYLFEILDGINLKGLTWKIGGGESYFIENNTLGEPLFPTILCVKWGRTIIRKFQEKIIILYLLI